MNRHNPSHNQLHGIAIIQVLLPNIPVSDVPCFSDLFDVHGQVMTGLFGNTQRNTFAFIRVIVPLRRAGKLARDPACTSP